MTTKTSNTYETIKNTERWPPCQGYSCTYQRLATGFQATAYNEPQHRALPPEPLFLHPTNLPAQHRFWSKSCLYSKMYTSAYELCKGGYRIYPTLNRYSYLAPYSLTRPQELYTYWSTALRNVIKGDSVNLASNLAEYRETADMFSKFAKGLSTGLRNLRKGKLQFRSKKARKRYFRKGNNYRRFHIDDLATADLLTSWGIIPLASDVARSVDALQTRFNFPIYMRHCATSKGSYSRSVSASTYERTEEWKMSQRAIVYTKQIPDNRKITVGNPLEWLWEATPWSVIIDWGIPIGQFLSSLDALKGIEATIGTLTTQTEYRSEIDNFYANYGYKTERKGVVRWDESRRDPISSIPLPRLPKWKPSPSWRKLHHATSILVLNRSGNPDPWLARKPNGW